MAAPRTIVLTKLWVEQSLARKTSEDSEQWMPGGFHVRLLDDPTFLRAFPVPRRKCLDGGGEKDAGIPVYTPLGIEDSTLGNIYAPAFMTAPCRTNSRVRRPATKPMGPAWIRCTRRRAGTKPIGNVPEYRREIAAISPICVWAVVETGSRTRRLRLWGYFLSNQ